MAIASRARGFGADVSGVDWSQPFSDSEVAALLAAVAQYKVLFFHGQHITSAQHLARGRQLGELEVHPFTRVGTGRVVYSDGENPELVVVESLPERPTVAEQWHSDTTWRDRPSLGSILRMTHKPESGGRTMWADMGAAYADLDAATRARIDGAVAVHDWPNFRASLIAAGTSDQVLAELQREYPAMEHPIVRTHPVTGEKILFVNVSFTTGITGMDQAEADELLARLYAQAHDPARQVALDWEPGDIAFWDNRSTQHAVTGDVVGHRRLERVTLVGDRPH